MKELDDMAAGQGRPTQGGQAPLSPVTGEQGTADLTLLRSGGDLTCISFTSHRRRLGPLVLLAKRGLSRLLTPILERQTAYNAANARVIASLKNEISALWATHIPRGLTTGVPPGGGANSSLPHTLALGLHLSPDNLPTRPDDPQLDHRTRAPSHAVAEFMGRKSYTREDALRYPLSIEAHNTGFQHLFYFMAVAKSLGLRPGDEVLDFGAGSCYVSELLNRFGYLTVAFDNDHEVLAIGCERLTLDPRCDRERARFVAGDGMCLPFRDASFDGIVCMNALHHMPDYRATLAEMYRVLKAGGRAAFSEPGEEHSKSPEAILAVEQYGALEKDIVLAEIYQLARDVGFRRMILKPFVRPEMVELDYEEFNRFAAGEKVSSAFLSAPEIAYYVKGQPTFCLEKGGTRPLTSGSAPAETLRARILIQECPRRAYQGGSMKVVALCENVGESTWLSKPRVFGGHVTFGVKFLTPEGRVLEDTRGRQQLAADVPPGTRIEVVSEVSLEGLKPGSYRVLFDMVNELVCWFQSVGSEVVERWIEIV